MSEEEGKPKSTDPVTDGYSESIANPGPYNVTVTDLRGSYTSIAEPGVLSADPLETETTDFQASKGLSQVIRIGQIAEECNMVGEGESEVPEYTYAERYAVAKYLEQNSEVESYEDFHPGDTVYTFTSMSLSEEFDEEGLLKENIYSAKWMNDNISHEFVNGLAKIRDYSIGKVFGGTLKVVTTNYKICSARLCVEGQEDPAQKIGLLNEEYISAVKYWALTYQEAEGVTEKQKLALRQLLESLEENPDIGLICGVAKVAEEQPYATEMDHYRNVRLALVQSTIEAKAKDFCPGNQFATPERQLLSKRVYSVLEDSEKIVGKFYGKVIRDRFGREYKIFEIAYDDQLNQYYQMNRDLMFALRKGEFRPDGNSTADALELKKYLRMVNILDVVAYHTQEDLEDSYFRDSISRKKEMIQLLYSGKKMDATQAKELGRILSENILFHNIQSSALFHRVASERNEGIYLSFDFIGVGIENVLDCERTTQQLLRIKRSRLENIEELVRKILISRGDRVTLGIRKKIDNIITTLIESGSPPIVAERTGDEIRVLLEQDPKETLLAHINSMNTRVSKIPIQTDRLSIKSPSQERVVDHEKVLDFINVTEEYSKYVEIMKRYLDTVPVGSQFDKYKLLFSQSTGFYTRGDSQTRRVNMFFVLKSGEVIKVEDARFNQDFMDLYVEIFTGFTR